ncbi:hypothetical protein DFJ73DRAFT_85730 [Zopfochytrium polystomum]|nr:hypothetical protein DFJ73DRAFT_85730 [Zopfochytrium polystomum]
MDRAVHPPLQRTGSAATSIVSSPSLLRVPPSVTHAAATTTTTTSGDGAAAATDQPDHTTPSATAANAVGASFDQSRSGSLAGSDAGLGTPDMLAGAQKPKIVLHTMPRRSSVTRLDKRGTMYPAQLVSYTSFGGKNHFPLIRDETTIGRKEGNNIVLLCSKISKYHAVIQRGENGFYLKDKNSSNGVRVNNLAVNPARPHKLVDGDKIQIGTIDLTFIDEVRNASAKRESVVPREVDENVKLVTILPSERRYEETVTISAEISADEGDTADFRKVGEVQDESTLREDYEKLRLAYELSKISVANDITPLLAKSMDLMFEILPVDRGVVLLLDQNTSNLATHYVKLREGKANEGREILLSSTILRKVFDSRVALVTRDAYEDPMLGKAASVKYGQIRSVICVPLIAHNKVHGILHLDSRDRINSSFSSKDLSLVKAVSNQTAMAIENMILVKEVEQKARITEQLSRFLAPHVVDKMAQRGNLIHSSGREITGTIIFVDIRGFTNFSEAHGPTEVVDLLNDYFERLVRIVFKYEGVVDKYIGDALMAVFGTLDEETDAEYRSVATALEFVQTINDMNEDRRRQGKEPISIGVGVNTGELLAGFIGCAQRLEYTCIGDTVNTSSRICSMAEKDQVLISEMTYQAVKNLVNVRPVGYRQFKGKTQEVMVYEALSLKKKP